MTFDSAHWHTVMLSVTAASNATGCCCCCRVRNCLIRWVVVRAQYHQSVVVIHYTRSWDTCVLVTSHLVEHWRRPVMTQTCAIDRTHLVRVFLTRSSVLLFLDHARLFFSLHSLTMLWSDMTFVDTITQWREDWSSASVVNHTIVTDPTIRQPVIDLPRHTWSLLNRFRTDQGLCRANLHKWSLAQSPSCNCGQRQTMSHIVYMCPLTKFEGGLNLLHEVDDDAVIWLEATATAALAKWMNE